MRQNGPLAMSEQAVFDALVVAADAGARCPTNEELGAMLDFGVSAAPGIIARLERQGLVRVERYQRERRVTIIASGAATAPVRTPVAHWRDRPRDVPSPPVHGVTARRPDTARDIFDAARRLGRMPAEFLADLVWVGWAHFEDDEIQAGATEGLG